MFLVLVYVLDVYIENRMLLIIIIIDVVHNTEPDPKLPKYPTNFNVISLTCKAQTKIDLERNEYVTVVKNCIFL